MVLLKVTKSMAGIVKGIDQAMKSMDMAKVSFDKTPGVR
jgi:hypothetical protein